MSEAINFPHLGIYLDHVGKSFSVFGIEIAYYGVTIAVAMLAGIFLALHVAKITGQNPDDYFDMAIAGIIVSVICARLYYVIFSWDQYKDDLLSILNTREGGLAIYGASSERSSRWSISTGKRRFPSDSGRYRELRHRSRPDHRPLGEFFSTGRPSEAIPIISWLCSSRWTLSVPRGDGSDDGAPSGHRRSAVHPGASHVPLRISVECRRTHFFYFIR